MNVPSNVPISLDGSDVADEVLLNVYDGVLPIDAAVRWIAELRREGLRQLAQEVADRLPSRH